MQNAKCKMLNCGSATQYKNAECKMLNAKLWVCDANLYGIDFNIVGANAHIRP